MREAAIHSACFLIVLVLLDLGLGTALRAGLARVDYGDTTGLINLLIEERGVDVLVFGSSRAVAHVDIPRIEQELGVSAYNFGSAGRGIHYARLLLALMVQRGGLGRLVVLQAEPNDLYLPRPERVQLFAPYYDENETVRQLLAEEIPLAPLKFLSRTYRFNSLLFSLASNVVRPEDPIGIRGYRPFQRSLIGEEPPGAREADVGLDSPVEEPLPAALAIYREFIEEVEAQGSRILLFTGPRFRSGPPGPREAQAIRAFSRLADELGVAYVPLTQAEHSEFTAGHLYGDADHLNALGARLLTDVLIREIRARHLLGRTASARR